MSEKNMTMEDDKQTESFLIPLLDLTVSRSKVFRLIFQSDASVVFPLGVSIMEVEVNTDNIQLFHLSTNLIDIKRVLQQAENENEHSYSKKHSYSKRKPSKGERSRIDCEDTKQASLANGISRQYLSDRRLSQDSYDMGRQN